MALALLPRVNLALWPARAAAFVQVARRQLHDSAFDARSRATPAVQTADDFVVTFLDHRIVIILLRRVGVDDVPDALFELQAVASVNHAVLVYDNTVCVLHVVIIELLTQLSLVRLLGL